MKNKKILVRDIGRHSFLEAWKYQEKIFQKIIDQKVQNRSKYKKIKTKNFLILTEHNHVYTIGKSGDVNNLLIDKDELSKKEIEYFKINRGGDITYHGPGQIMAYPIFDLDNFFTDINLYLRKQNGELLWKGNHIASSRAGTIPLSPISLASGIFSASIFISLSYSCIRTSLQTFLSTSLANFQTLIYDTPS